MYIIEYFGLSLRRACKLIRLSRTSFRYIAKDKPDEIIIRAKLKEIAQKRRRFGCPRLHVMLRRARFFSDSDLKQKG